MQALSRSITQLLFFTSSFLFCLYNVQAQDTLSLQEVIVSAPRSPGDSLRHVSSNSITQMLDQSNNIYLKTNGGSGSITFSARGGSSSQSQIFWDGIQIGSPMLALSDLSTVAFSHFESLVIEQGNEALWAHSGIFGAAVNLQELEEKQGTGINWQLGSFGQQKMSGTTGFDCGNFYMNSSLSYNELGDTYRYRDSGAKATQRNSQLQQFSHLHQLGLKTPKDHLHLTTWWTNTQRGIPPIIGTNTRDQQRDLSFRSKFSWTHTGRFNPKLTFAYRKESILYNALYSEFRDLQQKLILSHNIDKWNFQGLLNAQQSIAEADNYTEQAAQFNTSLGLNVNYTFNEQWQSEFAFKQQWQKDKLLPPVLLGKMIFHAHKDVKISYSFGRNIRLPSLNDLFWQPGGNPDLKPEHSTSHQFDLSYYSPSIAPDLKVLLGLYHSKVSNWLQWQVDDQNIWLAQNLDAVISQGLDLDIQLRSRLNKIQIFSDLSLSLSSTKNKAPNRGFGETYNKQLLYSPQFQCRIGQRLVYNSWSLQANLHSNSRRYINPENTESLDAFVILDLQASHRWPLPKGSIELWLASRNITDISYFQVAQRPLPGRSFELGLGFHLP